MAGRGAGSTRTVWPAAAVALVVVLVILLPGGSPTASTTSSPPQSEIAAESTLGLSAAGWSRRPAGPLESRTGQATLWTGDALVVWGGRSLGGDEGTGARYEPGADGSGRWTMLSETSLAGGIAPVFVGLGRNLLLFTGDAAMLDSESGTWSAVPAPIPEWRPLAASATDDEVVLIGRGEDDPFAVAYGLRGECCRHLPDPPIDLEHGRAVWTGDRMLLFGSPIGGQADAALEMASLDPGTGEWTLLPSGPLSGDRGWSSAWVEDSLLVVDRSLRAAAWDAASGWHVLPDPPFDEAGCFPQVAAGQGWVFAWYCRQAALYDPAAGVWHRIEAPRLDPHAVSTSCSPVAAAEVVMMWCGNGDGGEPFFWEINVGLTEEPG